MADELGGCAFSLNLPVERECSLTRHSDPTRCLSHYIQREMRRRLGSVLPFAFVFEVSPEGRLHAHGVVLSAENSLSHRRRLVETFSRAGGKIEGNAAARQCKLRNLYHGAGWADYIKLDWRKTVDMMRTEKLTFISQELLQMTRSRYEEMRRALDGSIEGM